MTEASAADCVFYQILSGTAEASFVHRDDRRDVTFVGLDIGWNVTCSIA